MSKKNVKPDHPVYAPPPAYAYAPPALVAPDPYPPQPVDPYQSASARILQDRNATVAKVGIVQSSGFPPDFSFTATGSSKREQGDRFNARTGELMSLSRAYLKLSRQLMSAARELVEPEPAPEYLVPPEFAAGAQEYDALEEGEPQDWVLDEAQQEQLDHAIRAFNGAAEALNDVRNVLGQFV